ncbi:MAG TPA: molybdate ABC transporter substrate-binding protein [Rhizomicrobium sp.]|jgi:molybdate transport system substrate-binding protein|nr:molybdate ABC transporter substrate-binding protein [Rhizomicrobium sp.]
MKTVHLALAALFAALLSLSTMPTEAADSGAVTVFAAASLTDALNEIGKAYEARTGKHVVFSFAASSVLAHQIESSSGADMFLSADKAWMIYLDTKGLMRHDTVHTLLGNHLVLIAPADSRIAVTIAPHFDILAALGGGRLAIADPDSVPAGKYGRQALTSLGVWNDVVNHLAQAENVRAALAYVARGETPLGIVYTTDAMAEPKVRIVAEFPDDSHVPIVYPVGLTKDAKPGAADFLAFLGSDAAIAIFKKDGFIYLTSRH